MQWGAARCRALQARREWAKDDRVGAADRVPGRRERVRARARGLHAASCRRRRLVCSDPTRAIRANSCQSVRSCAVLCGLSALVPFVPTRAVLRMKHGQIVFVSPDTGSRSITGMGIQGGGRRFDDVFTIRNGGAGFAGVFGDFSGNRHRIARGSVPPPARRGAGPEWKRHYGPAGGPFVGETSSQPSSCKASQAQRMFIGLCVKNPFGCSSR